ncbi:MAG: DUF6291 domain-containing protein [Chitinophagales bacterium]
MRDSSIFYRSFYEAIKSLPESNQLEVYNAIFEYSFNFVEIELTGLSSTIFTLIKPQLEANNKRYENGNKPKNKQNGSKKEAKDEQKISKVEANKNVNKNNNENENNNITDRIQTFKTKVYTYNNIHSVDMLYKFFNYWSELNKSGTKMRFELEKTWEIEKRLATWKNNGLKYDKPAEKNETQIKSMLQQRKEDAAKLLNNNNDQTN